MMKNEEKKFHPSQAQQFRAFNFQMRPMQYLINIP